MKPAELTPLSRAADRRADGRGRASRRVSSTSCRAPGATAGEHLAEHPGVARSPSPGSTAVGRRIVEASAGNLKRVQLELGGKGANIVFDDADLEAAVNGSAFAIFHNQGQACIAGSRLILHETIADEFLDAVRRARRVDPPRRSARPGHRDGAAHLGRAPRPRARATCDVARERGRRDADRRHARRTIRRWPAAATSRPTVVRAEPPSRGLPGRGLRPVRHGDDVPHRRGGARDRQRRRVRPRRRAVDARPVARPRGRARDPRRAWSGSTATSGSTRARRSAASALSGYGREMGFEAMREYTEAKSRVGQRRRRSSRRSTRAGAGRCARSPTTRCPGGSSSASGAFDRCRREIDRLGRAARAAHRRPLRRTPGRTGWPSGSAAGSSATIATCGRTCRSRRAEAARAAGPRQSAPIAVVTLGGGSTTGLGKAVALDAAAARSSPSRPPTRAPR